MADISAASRHSTAASEGHRAGAGRELSPHLQKGLARTLGYGMERDSRKPLGLCLWSNGCAGRLGRVVPQPFNYERFIITPPPPPPPPLKKTISWTLPNNLIAVLIGGALLLWHQVVPAIVEDGPHHRCLEALHRGVWGARSWGWGETLSPHF